MIEELVDKIVGMDPHDLVMKLHMIDDKKMNSTIYLLIITINHINNGNYWGSKMHEKAFRQAVRYFVMFGGVRID